MTLTWIRTICWNIYRNDFHEEIKIKTLSIIIRIWSYLCNTCTVWKEAFSSQDDDCDGLISVGKLEPLLKSIGCNPTEEDVQKVISKFNKTGKAWHCV